MSYTPPGVSDVIPINCGYTPPSITADVVLCAQSGPVEHFLEINFYSGEFTKEFGGSIDLSFDNSDGQFLSVKITHPFSNQSAFSGEYVEWDFDYDPTLFLEPFYYADKTSFDLSKSVQFDIRMYSGDEMSFEYQKSTFISGNYTQGESSRIGINEVPFVAKGGEYSEVQCLFVPVLQPLSFVFGHGESCKQSPGFNLLTSIKEISTIGLHVFPRQDKLHRFFDQKVLENEIPFIDDLTKEEIKGIAVELYPYSHQLSYCHYVFTEFHYEMIAGILPDGLSIDDTGCIRGVIGNLDLMNYNDTQCPSFTWVGEDLDGNFFPAARQFKIKIRVQDRESLEFIRDEWFYIRVVNNWHKDTTRFIKTIDNIELKVESEVQSANVQRKEVKDIIAFDLCCNSSVNVQNTSTASNTTTKMINYSVTISPSKVDEETIQKSQKTFDLDFACYCGASLLNFKL